MATLYIMAENAGEIEALCRGMALSGYACRVVSVPEEVSHLAAAKGDALLLEGAYPRIEAVARRIKRETKLPVIALAGESLDGIRGIVGVADDFLARPWEPAELELRLARLQRTWAAAEGELIGCGDLSIDVSRYEVTVAGRPVALTFKEYELLKFLASSPDRVFTRETLLSQVWGYDYYGGDRTVDVHIQRLRSKIESSKQVAIETVRNIGYRLKTEAC